MAILLYHITGRVIDASTNLGASNLRVEAWDKDIKYNDLLGNAITNADGGFEVSFDTSYFREYAPDDQPDLFFKVFLGKKLVKSTEDAPIKNAKQDEDVRILINLLPVTPPEGKDRVSTAQIFKTVAFFQESDFMGVYTDFRKKTGTNLGFISDMVVNTLTKLDLEPIRVIGVKEDEIIGKDVDDVKGTLRERKIAVTEVRTYNPEINAESIKNIKTLPSNLKPGQSVNLYQENGKVRYYTIVNPSSSLNIEEVKTADVQNKELLAMNRELLAAKALIAKKDEQLLQLNEEVKAIRKNQEEVNALLKSDAFTTLLKTVQTPDQPNKKIIKTPK